MVEQFAAPPINPIVSIRPLGTSAPGREATAAPTPLSTLPPGTTLQGFVVNRDANNNPILRTELGDLQMQSDVFVKTGSEMVIRVDATSESRARIITIDGLPPQEYATQNARGLTQDTIMQSALWSQRPAATAGSPLPAAPGMQAMLLNGPASGLGSHPLFAAWQAAGGVVPSGLLKLQAGAPLKIAVLEMEMEQPLEASGARTTNQPGSQATRPSQGPTQPQANAAATSPSGIPSPEQAAIEQVTNAAAGASARHAMVAGATAEPAKPTQSPSPASTFIAHDAEGPQPTHTPRGLPTASLHAYQQASATPHTPTMPVRTEATTTAPTTQTVPAMVIGHEADGSNVLQTPIGVLKIYSGAPLPMHAKLSISIIPAPPEDGPAPAPLQLTPYASASAEGDAITPVASEWPHLERALSHLGAMEPALARELAQAIPQAGPKLGSDLLFFVAALKGGDMRQWLGNRLSQALESKVPEMASRLKTDMAQMQQWFSHSPFDQWNSMLLPIMHQQQVDYARLFLRDEQAEGDKQQGGAQGQRFIVEVQLSHLGDMQFDGFVRPTAPKKQFDLVIRSARPLEGSIANDIRGLFDTALAATGYTGYLAFQQGAQHFVRPAARGSHPDGHAQDGQTILA